MSGRPVWNKPFSFFSCDCSRTTIAGDVGMLKTDNSLKLFPEQVMMRPQSEITDPAAGDTTTEKQNTERFLTRFNLIQLLHPSFQRIYVKSNRSYLIYLFLRCQHNPLFKRYKSEECKIVIFIILNTCESTDSPHFIWCSVLCHRTIDRASISFLIAYHLSFQAQ